MQPQAGKVEVRKLQNLNTPFSVWEEARRVEQDWFTLPAVPSSQVECDHFYQVFTLVIVTYLADVVAPKIFPKWKTDMS
jgi:hypothetical protein